MSASVTAGLLFISMLTAFLVPVATFAMVAETGKKKWVGPGFVAWLPFVFAWTVLYLRLIEMKPEWYDEGPLDVVNGWGIFFTLVAAAAGFIFTLVDDLL